MAKRVAAPAKARKPARRAAARAKAAVAERPEAVAERPGHVEDAACVVAGIALPESVILASHYAYYGDDGALHAWAQDAIVTNPREIADLLARGAPVRE
jgi:hypothetical protein